MVVVDFFVPGRAVSQPRVTDGKHGDHKIMAPAGHAIRGWRAGVKAAAQRAMSGRPPVVGPVHFHATFIFARPQRLCKLQWRSPVLQSGEAYIGERVDHTQDPDWDNLGKAIGDSLKMVVWVDDCQVCDGRVTKRFADHGDDKPGVWVRVWQPC